MKLKNLPLHTKIFIALVLGSLFGAFFSVDQHKLNIYHVGENNRNEEQIIEDWDSVHVQKGETTKVYDSDDQLQIINIFSKSTVPYDITVFKGDDSQVIPNVVLAQKIQTPATYIQPLGDLFIRLLSFLAIPLVIASLVIGAASLGDVKQLGRIGGKTLSIYILSTAVAISIGLICANVIQPGKKVDVDAKNRLMGAYEEQSAESITKQLDVDILEFVVNIVPKNPVNAIANGNMIQIVFFAVIFGITLTFIEKRKADAVISVFDGVNETMIKMVEFIMIMAPYGVFALMAATIADFGFEILQTLIWYIFAVILGLTLQVFIVYAPLVKIFGKMGIFKFLKGMRNAQAIAFSTSSSAATLPVTFDCVENNLGVSKKISGFVLPLGATINMDGTALYQGVAAIFISQVYGMDLNLTQQLTIVFTAVLASIGTAPVPGVGIIMLVMILQSVNIPPEGIALILGVDRILDMIRTITNITGDAAVSVSIEGMERAAAEKDQLVSAS